LLTKLNTLKEWAHKLTSNPWAR